MSREAHVRFCERLGVKLPRPTHLYGRFVADVFYDPTLTKKEAVATKGIFLNQELLTAGYADLML